MGPPSSFMTWHDNGPDQHFHSYGITKRVVLSKAYSYDARNIGETNGYRYGHGQSSE